MSVEAECLLKPTEATSKKPARYWKNIKNAKEFVEDISKELGIIQVRSHFALLFVVVDSCNCYIQLSDWYTVSPKEVKLRGGRVLIQQYGSLERVLKRVYPDFDWEGFKFVEGRNKAPSGFWVKEENLLEALQRAEDKIGIKEVSPHLLPSPSHNSHNPHTTSTQPTLTLQPHISHN